MTSVEFKPSNINAEESFPPFVATFKKTEAEVCAAWMVRTLKLAGDEWRAVTFADIRDRMRADMEACVNPWGFLAVNPFARPDPHRLVADGFAEWVGDAGPARGIQFTAAGFGALRKWLPQ